LHWPTHQYPDRSPCFTVFGKSLVEIAGLRNVLAHRYRHIDTGEIYRSYTTSTVSKRSPRRFICTCRNVPPGRPGHRLSIIDVLFGFEKRDEFAVIGEFTPLKRGQDTYLAGADTSDMPTVTTALNRPAIPTDGARITAEIDVEPGRQQGTVQRQILLCIDTSGSMSDEKIQRARDGASWVFGLLEPDDYVGIVAFDSEAEIVMGPTKWGETSREEAMEHVEELSAGGGTDIYDGLTASREALVTLEGSPDSRGEAAVRRVLLLSDGKDNDHDTEEFRELAREIDDAGIRIESAGIGEDYEEATIRALGTAARGTWTHLEAAGDIESFFGDAVETANDVVAADAALELDVAPGVEVSEVYRALPQAQAVEPDWEDNTAVVKLPDLTERERQQVVLKIQAPAHESQEGVPLVQVRLTARGGRATDRITVDYTDDNAELARDNEAVQMNHRQTVIRTELGRGNVEAAETQVERMTRIHGEEAPEVEQVKRQTKLVKEGGRAERNRATKIVDDEGRQ